VNFTLSLILKSLISFAKDTIAAGDALGEAVRDTPGGNLVGEGVGVFDTEGDAVADPLAV
jgi:hypothetical protein